MKDSLLVLFHTLKGTEKMVDDIIAFVAVAEMYHK